MATEYKPEWDDELEEMNRGKVGRPFRYPNSMMAFVAICRVMLGIGYRECERYLVASWGRDRAPDYSSIWKRIGKTMPKFERSDMLDHVLSRDDQAGARLDRGKAWQQGRVAQRQMESRERVLQDAHPGGSGHQAHTGL